MLQLDVSIGVVGHAYFIRLRLLALVCIDFCVGIRPPGATCTTPFTSASSVHPRLRGASSPFPPFPRPPCFPMQGAHDSQSGVVLGGHTHVCVRMLLDPKGRAEFAS